MEELLCQLEFDCQLGLDWKGSSQHNRHSGQLPSELTDTSCSALDFDAAFRTHPGRKLRHQRLLLFIFWSWLPDSTSWKIKGNGCSPCLMLLFRSFLGWKSIFHHPSLPYKNHSNPAAGFQGVRASRNWELQAPPPDEWAAAGVTTPHLRRQGSASSDAAGSKSSRRCEISQWHSSGHLCCVHISLQSVNTLNYCWICENEKNGDGPGSLEQIYVGRRANRQVGIMGKFILSLLFVYCPVFASFIWLSGRFLWASGVTSATATCSRWNSQVTKGGHSGGAWNIISRKKTKKESLLLLFVWLLL